MIVSPSPSYEVCLCPRIVLAGWSILGNFTRGDIPHTNFLLVNIPRLHGKPHLTAKKKIQKNISPT
ncbi:hypothetical protein C2845_PM01G13800 [Panicum miliaceum]|uniref:Uncharacterized protein n=1 Tax=Panicum miliaceum TaxID=4540 RepID=A0A3L6TGT4_PANMI|nr:hypothetical protein C2845_PM01G13800 [Panicum miliaceum]